MLEAGWERPENSGEERGTFTELSRDGGRECRTAGLDKLTGHKCKEREFGPHRSKWSPHQHGI